MYCRFEMGFLEKSPPPASAQQNTLGSKWVFFVELKIDLR